MATSVRQSLTMARRLLAAVAVAATGLLLPLDAQAEIILDDFDEAFEIILPEDLSFEFNVQQANIGALGADRWSQAVALSSRPEGSVDAELSRASSLNAQIGRLNPRESGTSLTSIALNEFYFFDEIDITQGGVNDRVVLDFAFLRSAVRLARVDVFIQDASQPGVSYVSQLFDIPPGDEPFALQFPFDTFDVRGGGVGQIDFRRVYSTYLTLYPVWSFSFSGPNEIGFSTSVDRIRFSNAIPEPDTGILACFAAVAAFLLLFRGRRIEPCGTGQSLHYRQECSCSCSLRAVRRHRN